MTSTTTYTGTVLRVDLSCRQVVPEVVGEALRNHVGGTGLGAHYLYEMVTPGIEWNDPGNILFFGAGPLSGTVGGTGMFSVVTKGPQTNGAVSTQANGFFAAFLKSSGIHGLLFHGTAEDWVYLYVHDGMGEIRDARALVGKDTWQTEELIARELGLSPSQVSIFSIGPAGEHRVRFASIVGDRGHVAAHGGVGAVMGAKKLKAIVARRDPKPVPVKDKETLKTLGKQMVENIKNHPTAPHFRWGTSMLFPTMLPQGLVPIKNLTGTDFPDVASFAGENYRPRLEMKRHPCWACQLHHCHLVKIIEGPYAGYTGEEPDYEDYVAFGPLIGQTDPQAVIVLSDINDRLGMDTNETGWLLGMLMECYERGILTKKDLDGIDLTWGNVEAVKALLPRIAHREGPGDIFAEGTKRAAARLGPLAEQIGVYFKTGAAPRGHDHRARWDEMLDVATSSTSTLDSASSTTPIQLFGQKPSADPFFPSEVERIVAGTKGRRALEDSLLICAFTCRGSSNEVLTRSLNAVTGWDWEPEEVSRFGLRVSNLLRCFDIRHGRNIEEETPSFRYGSTPTYGPAKGKSILDHWQQMRSDFYRRMGWDQKTGTPLPETLRSCGLDDIISDMYPGAGT
jgi:aldehyde:ferredoxin oxidoreductase